MEASLSAVAGGLGAIVLGLIGMLWRTNRTNGGVSMYDVLSEIREVKTILKERLPHR